MNRPRRGVIAVMMLACLLVAALMGAAIVTQSLMARRLAADEERRLQADWLAESGLERAAVRLAADPSYAGETWAIGPEVLGGRYPGEVVIAVAVDGDGQGRRVRVAARYPSDAVRAAQRTKQRVIGNGPDPGPTEGARP